MTLETEYVFLTDSTEDLSKRTHYQLGDSMSLMLCRAGSMDIIVNGKKMTVLPQHLFVVLPNTYIGEYTVSYDFRFTLLRIKAELFQQILFDNFRIEPRWWEKQRFLKLCPVLHLEPIHIELLDTYYHLMKLYLSDPIQSRYRVNITHSAVRMLVLEMFNYLDTVLEPVSEEAGGRSITHSDYTFRHFLELLQNNPHRREVQWYAEQMNITPKYLSEICKMRSGKSASEWIVEVTMNDIKQRLVRSGESIKEVAFQLGFPNSSFFCQYVKKHTGMTPNHLRKRKDLQ